MTCDMRLGRVLGLPAVLGERMLGHVERTVLERDGQQLRGLVIRRGLGGAKWIARENIGVLGDVSVIAVHPPVRPPKDADFELQAVRDESGLTLGRVTDAWISPDTFCVTALEVTLGWTEDLLRGRRRVLQWTVQPGNADGPLVLIPREEWEVTR